MSNIFSYSTGWLKGRNGTTGDYKYTATIELNSQNIAANTSNITATLTLEGEQNSGALMWNAPNSETNRPYARLTGDVSATGPRIAKYNKSTTPLTLVTWTGDVEHDADGTKTLSVVFDWVAGDLIYYPASFTVTTASVALPDIQRGVQLVFDGGRLHNNLIGIPLEIRVDSGITVIGTLTADINGSSWTVWSGTITADHVDKLAANKILQAMPSTTTDTATVTLSLISPFNGTLTASAPIVIDTSVYTPDVTVNSVNISSGGLNGNFVAGYTVAEVDYTTLNSFYATQLTNKFKISTGTMATTTNHVEGNGTVLSDVLPASASDYAVSFRVNTTDSRGATATDNEAIVVKGYEPPKVYINAYRCNSGGTADSTGAYVKCTFTASCSLTTEGNTVSVSGTMNGSAYTSGTITSLPAGSSATFAVTATDAMTSTTRKKTVPSALLPLDLYDNGNGHPGAGIAGAFADGDEVNIFTNSVFRFFLEGTALFSQLKNSSDADTLYPSTNQAFGLYYRTNNTGSSHWPATTAYTVILAYRLTAGAGVQFAWCNGTTVLYMRVRSSSTWQAWKSVTFS